MTMQPERNGFSMVVEAGKAATVASLCVMMAVPQAWAADPVRKVAKPVQKTATLTPNEKTLHALNRLTFGPRPGDEQAVTKIGFEAWFQKQLHPETIDDSGLETRLDQFPALRLSQTELMQKFPTPQTLRNMARRGGSGLPTDPVEHAIYADSMAAYEAAINGGIAAAAAAKADAAKADAAASGDMAMAGGDMAGTSVAGGDMAGGDMMAAAPGKTAATPQAKNKKKQLDAEPMSREDVRALIQLPADERFAKLVAMSPEEMAGLRKAVRQPGAGLLVVGMTPEQKEDVAAMQGGLRVIGAEALSERMLRDVYSDRQLQAVMDDFWLNHFSVYVRKNQNEPYYLSSYQRDSILPNSMGKFEDLLVATAKSPAMLTYLDNWESIGPNSPAASRGKRFAQIAPNSPIAKQMPKGINENYARELIELHTFGARCEVSAEHPATNLDPSCGGGYTQADVIAVAKCFTGWTVDRPYQNGGGGFVFEAARHEPGPKTVLGHVIPEGGENEAIEVLHILASSPATAHFVSNKLAERFVSDVPPAAMVDRMAAAYLKSDGDIKAVLTAMVHSPEFWTPTVYRAKVKTPIEFVASALRASGADVQNPLPLVQAMEQLGMPIYGMQTPNGYSWQADHWVSSNALVSRMNFALVLSGNKLPGAQTDWPKVLGESDDLAATPTPKTETALEGIILGQTASDHTRQTVLNNYNDPSVQQTAVQNFAQGGTQNMDNGGTAAGLNDTQMAQNMLRKNAGAVKRGGGQGYGFQADKPGTPLDTMAGLLLGSPDFQRR